MQETFGEAEEAAACLQGHERLGKCALETCSSLSFPSEIEKSQVVHECIERLLESSSNYNQESIVHVKLLSDLLSIAEVRNSLHNPEGQLLPTMLHSINHQLDPTDFIFELFAFCVKLLVEHPVEDVSKLMTLFN